MSLQTVVGGLWIPRPMWFGGAIAPAFTTVTLDAGTDRFAGIFKAPKTGNIDRVVIQVGAVTTAAALDVRIETVNTADANPSGSLWAANTSATTGSPSANTAIEVTLTASAAVTRGNVFAIVVQPNATPISLAMNAVAAGAIGSGCGTFPYGCNNTTGSYANTINVPCMAVRYDTGEWAYLGGPGPILSFAASAFDDGTDTAATTGSRRGLYFQLPFPATLSGMWAEVVPFTTSGDFTIKLYDSGGSLLATLATIDANQQASTFSGQGWQIYFDSDYELAANTNYRLVIQPTTTTNVTLYEYAINSAGYMDAFEGGQNFHLTKFVSSAWVEVTTERPWMGLLLTACDSGGGGGAAPIFVVCD